MEYRITEGNYRKFGVQKIENGMIFTFAGEKEDDCCIHIYDEKGEVKSRIEVPADYCMGSVRSIYVQGLEEKKLHYNYVINGEVVVDTYAECINGRERWNSEDRKDKDYQVSAGYRDDSFDWDDDVFPEVSRSDMVMYKLHVRGFSMDAGIRGKEKGTFAAVKNKISYLKDLGVTTVEFMPIYEFEEKILEEYPAIPDYLRWQAKEDDLIRMDEKRRQIGLNYWGYAKDANYFAVKASYGASNQASLEWKNLVKELHKNGMECVMEMFFGDEVNQNVILDALRFWVREYHVDGFHLIGKNIPVTAIAQDLFLSRTKLFYDYFDGYLYEQKQSYPHLFVYSDEYLYPARKILNRQGGTVSAFLDQQRKQHEQLGFVNYIANNNGFTLYDVFAYQEKHNELNGEANTDGNNWNYSSNCGVEGKTGKRFVNDMRRRQLRNAVVMQFVAQGVPLLLAGDEFGNTQEGNNNAYCQDNKLAWLNWKQADKYKEFTTFVKQMIAFRREHPVLRLEKPMQRNDYGRKGFPDLSYHGEAAWISEFPEECNVAGTMYCGAYAVKEDQNTDDFIYVGYNFGNGMGNLALPKLPDKKEWYLVMDTSENETPFFADEQKIESFNVMKVKAKSIVILIGK